MRRYVHSSLIYIRSVHSYIHLIHHKGRKIRPYHVWKYGVSNLRPLRLGEEKRRKCPHLLRRAAIRRKKKKDKNHKGKI